MSRYLNYAKIQNKEPVYSDVAIRLAGVLLTLRSVDLFPVFFFIHILTVDDKQKPVHRSHAMYTHEECINFNCSWKYIFWTAERLALEKMLTANVLIYVDIIYITL